MPHEITFHHFFHENEEKRNDWCQALKDKIEKAAKQHSSIIVKLKDDAWKSVAHFIYLLMGLSQDGIKLQVEIREDIYELHELVEQPTH